MNRIKFIQFLSFAAVLLALSSCNSFLTIEDPEDKTISEEYYNSAQRVEQAVIGIYVDFRRALLSNRSWLMYGEARAGDLAINADCYEYVANQVLTANNDNLVQLTDWEYFYDVLDDANQVLQIIEDVDDGVLTESEYNLFKGEALALKSFAYFYLARIWGDVPSEEAGDFNSVGSSTVIIEKALALAQEADNLLPWMLINADGIESSSLTETRMNKTAIKIIQAQQNLWLGNNQEAYTVLATAIDENTENKWSSFGFSLGDDTRTDIPSDPLDASAVTISLEKLNAIYPEGDARRGVFDISEESGTASLLDQVQDITQLLTLTNYDLLLSEAAWKINKLDEAKTILVEVAAGATEDYSTLEERDFEQALLLERQRLLMGSGIRFFDLMRFGKVDSKIPMLSADDVATGAAYWPLSEKSIKDNSLNQNSYWSK